MYTYSFAVDNTAFVAVVVQTVSSQIEIFESDQAGTTDYLVCAPYLTSAQVTIPAGKVTVIRPTGGGRSHFNPGDTVAYVKTVSGSITIGQVEN